MRRLSGLIKYLPQDNSPKLMCWACSCSYKRALAKTKHSDPARSGILVILVFVVSVLTFWSFALRFNTSEQYLFIAGTQLFSQKRKRESQQMKKERRKNATITWRPDPRVVGHLPAHRADCCRTRNCGLATALAGLPIAIHGHDPEPPEVQHVR